MHTPAPWHQAPAPDESGIDISSGGSVIATAWSGLDPDDAVMNANARLICASPDLLAVCKPILDAEPFPPNVGAKFTRAQRAVEAAIAHAEGVQ